MLLAAAFLAAGCTKDNGNGQIEELEIGIADTDTKVSLGTEYDKQINLLWSAGDKVYVKGDAGESVFRLKSGEGSTKGIFEYESGATGQTRITDVVYPASNAGNTPTSQTYQEGTFDPVAITLAYHNQASTSATKILLGSESSVLCFQIKGNDKLNNIAVTFKNGKTYTGAIGAEGCVPNCVSRYKPAEQSGHCQIAVAADGTLTVSNLKANNSTYINGVEVLSKRASAGSTIELGMFRFKVSLTAVLNAATKMVPQPVKEVDIRPLEKVYDEYHDNLLAITKRTQHINNARNFSTVLTMGSGIARFLPSLNQFADIFMLMFFTGLVILLVCVYLLFADKSAEKRDRVTLEFQKKYACPDCGYFLGNRPYHLLIQQDNCPNPKCRAKFIK